MFERNYRRLMAGFYACILPNGMAGIQHVIQLVREVGGEFLALPRDQIDQDPLASIQEGQRFAILKIEHSFLQRNQDTDPSRSAGSASLLIKPDTSQVTMSQDMTEEEPEQIERMAQGQLAVARLLLPHLRPQYGWIDETGNTDTDKDVANVALTTIFWANMLGSPYIERYGRNTFITAPGWRVEELPDGAILVSSQ